LIHVADVLVDPWAATEGHGAEADG
jgi:hypothetical protein